MAAMAAAQTVAAGALLGSSKSFGLGSKGFAAGAQLGLKGVSNGSRVSCRAALTIPKAREWLLAEAEKRWEAALEAPLAGVQFTHDEFADALSKYDFSFEVGDMVKGVVFKSDHNGALIDIGAKAPAYLPLAEACIHKLKFVDEVGLLPGTEEEFVIIRDDDDNGRMILSLKKIQYDLCWERSAQLLADDVVVRGTVLSANRGGLVVLVEGLRGFVPFSQITARTNPEELVNKEIPLKYLEVDEERTRLVLSNRKALAENQSVFGIGSVVEGTVQTVKPYGAFIDIGGVSGLLHISQISHDRLTTVETVLSPGDKLKVMILSQDKDRGRISLSTKKLEPTPGDMLRNPQLVYEKADEMAKTFRQRVAQAEAAARAEELRLQQEGGFGVRNDFSIVDDSLGLDELNLDDIPAAME
ncbi:hypothetical protein M758_12G039800 [Ceratodon purpureus]|uniref:S1 motif domain-containing protein n=1 Tax=Ceratodon purpureus TaxID=3225 RepID=A0A8T0G5Q9_CERPU|nr:hypothetical protein KC19_12G038800 [Ceratodon purpureus]KAG0598035.1 hypothetical protein M758_12G039800 [Ceratodon purpureus]